MTVGEEEEDMFAFLMFVVRVVMVVEVRILSSSRAW